MSISIEFLIWLKLAFLKWLLKSTTFQLLAASSTLPILKVRIKILIHELPCSTPALPAGLVNLWVSVRVCKVFLKQGATILVMGGI